MGDEAVQPYFQAARMSGSSGDAAPRHIFPPPEGFKRRAKQGQKNSVLFVQVDV
jgi:uncharacterized MAPEG superfamily protein